MSKVSSLLKTVKNVEDEASKGVQSLENTIDAVKIRLDLEWGDDGCQGFTRALNLNLVNE